MSERPHNEPAEQVANWHALLCEHGVDLDEQRCVICEGHEAQHDRVFEGEQPQ